MTVGASLPVSSLIWHKLSALSEISLRASVTSMLVTLLYFSRYILMVVPDEPVPDFLKTNLEPSAYLKMYP